MKPSTVYPEPITMPSRGGLSKWTAMLSTTLLLTSLAAAQSIPMDYCATINTGTGPGNHSDWQSDGLCSNFCKGSKSGLAIVRGSLCWCSNIMPSDSVQVGTDKCRDPCPGFPDDVCGGDGTWGYMRIRANPITGTTGGSAPASTTTRGSTVTGPVQDSKPPNPAPAPILTTTITALPSLSSTNSAGQQQTTSPPQVETVTADGTTRIVTVAPTGVAGSPQTPSFDSSRKEAGGGLGTGAAVGIAVGVISILVAGGIIGFIFLRRKRRQDREAQDASNPGNYGADMSQPTTGFATRRPTNGTWGSEHSSGRRSSMPDPRMKSATGVYGGTFINRSRESFESMQDNLDYSRPVHHPNKVLRVANPSEND
ncbi:hypothetical protein MCOR27_001464 [Pyricularia oryzae]|uniref:WSC domain-containing protein n=1 Tax=Pyricularia grisea TaxID=148305 RepID=A0ABQ8NWN0_PYRGI|nr:hypothetical protein MCOR02_002288 [Pyricularia oryzae]KAI6303202.1 hypothetical protein MCOR33_001647 [Pyricularia grisea]KAI6265665.1 hypothetical protein MCOR26_010616 [Pyricularia oryzae]KAI6287289.1 hypothetical protein MCOR27_001464 [Pyricularia oryzae]KAI6345503.1 hypothetical protein MCOR28_003572 [Pyricularia oryzae]